MKYKDTFNQLTPSKNTIEKIENIPDSHSAIKHYSLRKAALIAAIVALFLFGSAGSVYAATDGNILSYITQYVQSLKNGRITGESHHKDKVGKTYTDYKFEYDSEFYHINGQAIDLGKYGIIMSETGELLGEEDKNGEREKFFIINPEEGRYIIKGDKGTREEIIIEENG
jgi:hypothetical protein